MSSTDSRPVPCFDLGGVLIRICRSWREGTERAGVPWRERPAGRDFAPENALHQGYQRGHLSSAVYYERLSACWKGAYSPEEIDRIHRVWLLGAYPGVAEIIAEQVAAGPVAILSNTCIVHWEELEPMSMVHGVTHALASHEIGAVKPDDAAYHAVEQATGRSGSGIVFFDDSPTNIAAAQARGWVAHHIDHDVDSTAAQLRALLV